MKCQAIEPDDLEKLQQLQLEITEIISKEKARLNTFSGQSEDVQVFVSKLPAAANYYLASLQSKRSTNYY